jgi:hypothetical protein
MHASEKPSVEVHRLRFFNRVDGVEPPSTDDDVLSDPIALALALKDMYWMEDGTTKDK